MVLGHEVSICIQPIYRDVFDQMRAKLKILLRTVVRACIFDKEIPSLEELKTFLLICFRELKNVLKDANSFDDVMDVVIEKKCTLVNVACLEIIVNHYNIENAKAQIAAYKSEVDRLCEELKLKICEDYMSDPSSLLKCETIRFFLEWRPDNDTFSDIKELICKAFGGVAKTINVDRGNIIIIVSIVHIHLSGSQ